MSVTTVLGDSVAVVAFFMLVQDTIRTRASRLKTTIATAPVAVPKVAIVTFLARFDHAIATGTRNVSGTTESSMHRKAGTGRVPEEFNTALVIATVAHYPVAIVALFARIHQAIAAGPKSFRAVLAVFITTIARHPVAIIALFAGVEHLVATEGGERRGGTAIASLRGDGAIAIRKLSS
jgi:hypothetical protein